MTASKNTRVEVAGIEARLANLSTSSGYALGIETPAGIVNVTASGAALGLPAPRGLDDLLQAELAGQLHAVMEALVLHPGSAIVVAEHEVRFAPLVTRPEKIICVGFDYRSMPRKPKPPFRCTPRCSQNMRTPAAASVDRLTIFDGGEAHVTDISQWSSGVNVGKSAVFSNNAYLIAHGNDYLTTWISWSSTSVQNSGSITTWCSPRPLLTRRAGLIDTHIYGIS